MRTITNENKFCSQNDYIATAGGNLKVRASLFRLEIIISDRKFPSKEKTLVKSSDKRHFVSQDGEWLFRQVLGVYHATQN